MPLRRATEADATRLAELWAEAFPGERSVAERRRQLLAGRPFGGIETVWIHEDGGRLAGAFRAYRMTEYLGGAALPMMGLAAVAVAPAARRQGLGRSLCEAALRIARERGDAVSVLYPFRPSFYEALGWGLAGSMHAYTCLTAALPDSDGRRHVRPAEAADRAAIAECYDAAAAPGNGPLRRDENIWDQHLGPAPGREEGHADAGPASKRGTAFVYDDGGVTGYMIAYIAAPRRPDRRTLRVRELVARDEAAYRGMLGWIAAQKDQFPLLRYNARPQEMFELRIDEPRPPGFVPARWLWFPTYRVLRGPMIRVLDVPAALRSRQGWAEPGRVVLTLEIEIHDRELPENRGPWHVTLREDGPDIHEGGHGGADARLVTDAATFARIFAGEIRPAEAARIGRAAIDDEAGFLDRAFGAAEPFWLLDTF